MINNFYTLRALSEAWHARLRGTVLTDAFSQEAGELTLVFEDPDEDAAQSIRLGLERPFLFAFHSEGASKARRNVATLFDQAHGRVVEAVRVAERDRQFFIPLESPSSENGSSESNDARDRLYFQIPLFGAQANALLVAERDEAPRILEAFRDNDDLAGQSPPAPQAAPMPDDFEAFEARWRPERNRVSQAVSSAMVLFGPTLAEETVFRAGVEADVPADCTEAERRRLFEAAQGLRKALRSPAPRIYAEDWAAGTFSLIELRHRRAEEPEAFDTVNEAVRVYVRRRLAERRHAALKEPLEKALTRAVERHARTIRNLEGQLRGTPRADRYERFGHLLKAQAHDVEAGAEEVVVPDYFAEVTDEGPPTVRIPLQPELTAIQNAERFYTKAKDARIARQKAQERLAEARREVRRAEHLRDELRAAETLKALRRFLRERKDALATYKSGGDTDRDEAAFRRFRLRGGYEVLAGKNARQNHDLTFHHAQPYDLWLHARRVPGAHVVLRLPNRDAEPDRRAVQAAAGVAAYYSKARTSKLVPVMHTQRKYVRSPSGAPPGAVRVEREEVIMAEPRLPSQ